MFYLLHHKKYHWIDSLSPAAENTFITKFKTLLKKHDKELVFLCVGTPLLFGDCLGPYVGTALKSFGIGNVFGTLDAPVHAENIEFYRDIIRCKYTKPTIIAIDAALGTKTQTGYITLRHGALQPGKAVGKSIAPIGQIEVTGIFDCLNEKAIYPLMLSMSRVISYGIAKNMKEL